MLAPTNVLLLGTNLSLIHQPHVDGGKSNARKIYNILHSLSFEL